LVGVSQLMVVLELLEEGPVLAKRVLGLLVLPAQEVDVT
jgi:hypothetical protein